MASLPRLRQDILDNPVQKVEIKHLLRDSGSWFWRAVYAFTTFLLIAPILWGYSIHFQKTLEIVGGLLLFTNLVAIILVEMKAINYAVASVGREISGRTWELLTLTGVDSWRIIMGKWLGVFKIMLRDFGYLYVLRIGTIFWFLSRESLHDQGFCYHWRDSNNVCLSSIISKCR